MIVQFCGGCPNAGRQLDSLDFIPYDLRKAGLYSVPFCGGFASATVENIHFWFLNLIGIPR
jgi:hypothetical protein